jgi:hypothetical protein
MESVQTYPESPIIAEVSKRPALSDISAKQFGVIDEFSAITRGPVQVRSLTRRAHDECIRTVGMMTPTLLVPVEFVMTLWH